MKKRYNGIVIEKAIPPTINAIINLLKGEFSSIILKPFIGEIFD